MNNLILVTGSEGLVGSRFIEISENKTQFHTPTQIEFDITKVAEVKAILASFDFRAIVHFAAYTDVSEAEKERGNKDGDCWQINVEGTRNLVEGVAASGKNPHFIQISTDMVFSGSKNDRGPYKEDHPREKDPAKITWYGFTKSEAERIVSENLGDKAAILRIIYPVRAAFEPKLDYIRLPLSLYREGKLYPLFSDQQTSITFIDEACRVLDKIINEEHYGVFHAGSKDTTTPLELISYAIEKIENKKTKLVGVNLNDFLKETNTPEYRYPRFGGLKVEASESLLGLKFSSWKEIIDKLVAQGIVK